MKLIKTKHVLFIFSLLIFEIGILFFVSNSVSATKSNTSLASDSTSDKHSVKYYGAKGDGITDDTIAVTNAFSNCAGSTIYVPAGTYIISSTIRIPSNTKVVGEGSKSIFMAAEGAKADSKVFVIRDSNNISLSNITVSGNILKNSREYGFSPSIGIYLVDMWRVSNISFDNCFFIDNVNCALRLIDGCASINVDKCTFTNVDCGVIALGDGNVDSLTVKNSYFDGHYNSEPISLYGTGQYTNIIIYNNVIKNKTYGNAIYVGKNGATTNGLSIIGNKLYNNAGATILYNVTNAEIADNTIDCSENLQANSGTAMSFTNCANVNIHNNNISKIRFQGIHILNCVDLTLTNNSLTDCGYKGPEYHALELRGNCKNLTISDNDFIRNNLSLSDCFFAIYCSGSLIIKNNNFINCHLSIYDDTSNLTITGQ